MNCRNVMPCSTSLYELRVNHLRTTSRFPQPQPQPHQQPPPSSNQPLYAPPSSSPHPPQQPPPHPPAFEPHPAHQFAVQRAPTQEIWGRRVERLNKLVKRFSGRLGCGEFRTWKEDLLRAFTLSDITPAVDQATTISFLLDGDAAEYYHSLTKAVQDDWFELMRVLGQRFDCISHEPVYLSRMLSLKESEFPRHADYVRDFHTCIIKSKVNTSDLQMGYLVNSRFVEGLSNDAVRRQYIVEVRSRWRSNRPFGFDTLVETIAEAYIAAGYQLEEVQNTSRTTLDHTLGPAVSRPLPAYDGSTYFDFHIPIQPYANATRQPHAHSICCAHGFDRGRADEPRCNWQAPRRATCLHW